MVNPTEHREGTHEGAESTPRTPADIIRDLHAESDAEIIGVANMGGAEREVNRITKATVIAAEKGLRAAFKADADLASIEITADTITGLQAKGLEIHTNLAANGVTGSDLTGIDNQMMAYINRNKRYAEQRDFSVAEYEDTKAQARTFFNLMPIDPARIDTKAQALEDAEATRLNYKKLDLPVDTLDKLKAKKTELITAATGASVGFDATLVGMNYDAATKALEEMVAKPQLDAAAITAIKTKVDALLALKIPDVLKTPEETFSVTTEQLRDINNKNKKIQKEIPTGALGKTKIDADSKNFFDFINNNNKILKLSKEDKTDLLKQVDLFLNLTIPNNAQKKSLAEQIKKDNPTFSDDDAWLEACKQLEADFQLELSGLADFSSYTGAPTAAIDAAKNALATGITANITGIDPTLNRTRIRDEARTEVLVDFRKELNACTGIYRSLREMTNRDLMQRAGLAGPDLERVAFAERSGLERDAAVRTTIEKMFRDLSQGNIDPADLTSLATATGIDIANLDRLAEQVTTQREVLLRRQADQNVKPNKWATRLQLGAGLGLGGTAALLGAGTLAMPWLAAGVGVLGAVRIGQHFFRNRKVNQGAEDLRRQLQLAATSGDPATAVRPIFEDLRNSLYSLIASAKQTQIWEQTGGVRRTTAGGDTVTGSDQMYDPAQRNLLLEGPGGMRDIARARLHTERPDLNNEQIDQIVRMEEALLESDIGTYERLQNSVQRGGFFGRIGSMIRHARTGLVGFAEGRPQDVKGTLRGQLSKNFDQRAVTISLLVGAGVLSRYAAFKGMDWARSLMGGALLGFAGQAIGGGIARSIERNSDYFRLTHNVRVEELTADNIVADPSLVSRARAQISDRDWADAHPTDRDKLFMRLDQIEQALIRRQNEPLRFIADVNAQRRENVEKRLNRQTSAAVMNATFRLTGGIAGGALGAIGLGRILGATHDIFHDHDAVVSTTAGAEAAHLAPDTSPAHTPEVPAYHEYQNEILGTRGTDYESNSLKQLIHDRAEALHQGHDWERTEFAAAQKQLQSHGQWYNLTHQGDQVGMREYPDGHREYFFRAGSQAPAHDLPYHHHAPAVTHEALAVPPPEAAHPMPPSPELQHAVSDINHTYEDSMWPLKGTQARASLHQYWETLFGDAPFDKNVADQMVQDLRHHHPVTLDSLHDYGATDQAVAATSPADTTAVYPTGGEAPVSEPTAHPTANTVEHDGHANGGATHDTGSTETAVPTVFESDSSEQLTPKLLDHVQTYKYYDLNFIREDGSGHWVQDTTPREIHFNEGYTGAQKLEIIQGIRFVDVASTVIHVDGSAPTVWPSINQIYTIAEHGTWPEMHRALTDHLQIDNTHFSIKDCPTTLNEDTWLQHISDKISNIAVATR